MVEEYSPLFPGTSSEQNIDVNHVLFVFYYLDQEDGGCEAQFDSSFTSLQRLTWQSLLICAHIIGRIL